MYSNMDLIRKKGFQIIKKGNVELLLIKTEKLNGCQEVIGQFIGIKNFKWMNANVGTDKPYKFIYNEVKGTIKIPKQIIEFYYKRNKCMDHFYSLEEKKKFSERWSKASDNKIK